MTDSTQNPMAPAATTATPMPVANPMDTPVVADPMATTAAPAMGAAMPVGGTMPAASVPMDTPVAVEPMATMPQEEKKEEMPGGMPPAAPTSAV